MSVQAGAAVSGVLRPARPPPATWLGDLAELAAAVLNRSVLRRSGTNVRSGDTVSPLGSAFAPSWDQLGVGPLHFDAAAASLPPDWLPSCESS